MQLAGKPSVRSTLTAITAALLGSSAVHASAGNKIESSILLYSEVNRVQAAEGMAKLTYALKGNRILNARVTLDGLTGSSPNGATPSNSIQTFTRPSGSGSYSAKPGEIPLDNTFRDSRFGLDGNLTQPLNRLTSLIYGGHLSAESDYVSLGTNIGITHDFNRRNTTLSASAAFSHDVVQPKGGAPIPFSSIDAQTNSGRARGDDSGPGKNKNVLDAVFGVTQVLDRKTILRLNYSISHSTGYLNDPYKVLSVVQGSWESMPGDPTDYIYESRPGSHSKQAIFAQTRRFIKGHTLDLSYRYFWDNWGITSYTVDLFYRLPLMAGHALQPHFRWYRQKEADFYRAYLLNGSPIPTHASADYRLAPFHAITIGLQYFFPLAQGVHFSINTEYYRQTGDLSPPASLGVLSQSNLFPKMEAFMVRVGLIYDLKD